MLILKFLSTVFCILANFHHKVLRRERELIAKDRKTIPTFLCVALVIGWNQRHEPNMEN